MVETFLGAIVKTFAMNDVFLVDCFFLEGEG